jgi:hypothetical protein
MSSTTFSFIDERQFLTVIQPILPLHKCADPAPTESTAEALHSIVDSAAVEAAADPAAVEPLHSPADPVGFGATLTETFCLCVWV